MAISARTTPLRAALLAAILTLGAASIARADDATGPRPLSEDEAHKVMPRADLSGLNDKQRGVLFDIAGDTIDYAGCNSTLAACLRADVKDKHAPRMVHLAALLLLEGYTDTQVKFFLDQYYGSFAKERRKKLRADDCPIFGEAKAPVTLTEFSDYQCPHCARAVKPIHDLVEANKGKVKLCTKYFPLPMHPFALQMAGAAEYARSKGKFWPMHELLFAQQDVMAAGDPDAVLQGFAQKLGLNGAEMVQWIHANKFDETISAQKKEGLDAGVDSTPSIFFNGRLATLPGMQFLSVSLEDELEWQHNGGAWDKE